MDIKYLTTASEDDWAWLTEGHVDLDAFEDACRVQHPEAATTPPLHCWVRPADSIDETGEPRIDFCDEGDDAARPVTVIAADEFWDRADALAA